MGGILSRQARLLGPYEVMGDRSSGYSGEYGPPRKLCQDAESCNCQGASSTKNDAAKEDVSVVSRDSRRREQRPTGRAIPEISAAPAYCRNSFCGAVRRADIVLRLLARGEVKGACGARWNRRTDPTKSAGMKSPALSIRKKLGPAVYGVSSNSTPSLLAPPSGAVP